MLRRVAYDLLSNSSKVQYLSLFDKGTPLMFSNGQNIKNPLIFKGRFMYNFSTGQQKDQKINKNSQTKETNKQNVEDSTQKAQVIQVSIQQFRKMKQLLDELKSQISQLEKQQQGNPSTKNVKSESNNDLSKKLQQFSKQSLVSNKISQQVVNYEQDSSLFFKSLQQQLSFQLIKLTSKQQFNELIEHYLSKFNVIQSKPSTLAVDQQLHQLVNLSYLIFYRYTSLQNAKIDDYPIKNLLLKIVSHISDILNQTQVQKLLSILNDQIKQRENQFQNQQNNNTLKINAVSHQHFKTFVQQLKKKLLFNNNLFGFKLQTNKNSEILSLIFHLFDVQELSQCKAFNPILKKQTNDQNSQQKTMIYNPINLSHLIAKMFQSENKKELPVQFYELFQLSLSVTQKQFTSQQTKDFKIQIQESLKMINEKQFQRYQYESIIYFLENFPQTHPSLFLKFCKFLLSENKYMQKFQLIHQLRICYGFLTRPQLLSLDPNLDSKIVQQVQRVLLSSQTKNSLLQAPRKSSEVFDAQENFEFLHLKKVSMILSQIGIQLFKNYRSLKKQKLTEQIFNSLKQIVTTILRILNEICNEKVDLKDIFKNQQNQNVSQILILNLNLFQFIVNLNILSKWCSSLTGNPTNEQSSVQLLTNLVFIFIRQTKNTLLNNYNSEPEKLKLAEQMVIILLIGRQHSIIVKSIANYFEENENKQILGNLLQTTIGKNDKHKYFQQYLMLQKQFDF